MASRRSFLAGVAGVGLAGASFRGDAIARAAGASERAGRRPAAEVARDEDYWLEIKHCFDTDRTVINLNNGGVCPTPSHVLEQMIRDLRFTNESPVQHMWRVLEPRVESVRRELAREFGCDPEELAITRNATEAMATLIFGLDLEAGDEAIITDQNYPHMQTCWTQRARRDGVVVKKLSFPVPLPSPDVFLDGIRGAITDRTRVVELPQVTNWSGQVFPIREVCQLARERGIDVLVDGAHGFAQLPDRRDDLGCDFYGTSLHKWLLAPIGTGFLYVRKGRIKDVWPMMSSSAGDEDIRKFEEIGTHPAAIHNAIAAALAFHRAIGVDRKLARLRYLRDRWAKPLREADPRVEILTSIDDDDASTGIALVRVDGIDNGALFGHLWGKHQIVTSPTTHEQFAGVRISPNLYTTPDEIDVFVEAMLGVLADGI
ncbi:aminotransferase class V-fold PLP-dependent enzyme [Tautonia plasticadhaerens]|uniref:Isopenicillin N epimerase n=1 Tax=Tautonia plasticadhaerens TaxID=2527974 RepID=A0A518H060_9BACT|nr:aminotransferase class V-fold PLP-dependent enzyme [Tautonia plasticadhaerens]QDV34212.1 Isopenicillin N epimerase [Tautonia plasticadhaerens]